MKKLYYFFVGMRMRYNYWGCSKFADRLNVLFGVNKKPNAATLEEWHEYDIVNKQKSPIGFWITDTLLDVLQDIIMFPYDVYQNIKTSYINRVVTQTHVIKTGLPRGDWHPIDHKIEAGLFLLLVDYVEVVKAEYAGFSNQFPKASSARELGLNYLEWEILEGTPEQATIATEIKEIYLWIRDVRETRIEPSDLPAWVEYCAKTDNNMGILSIMCRSDEEKSESRKLLDEMDNISQRYDEEDTAMLIRIINIRNSLE